MRVRGGKIFFVVLLAAISSCTKKEPAAPQTPEQLQTSQLIEKGRRAYQVNCIACHNPNPKIDGVIGPSIAGSSLELLRARIMDAAYPAGYTSKRGTKSMVALPHLKDEIEALHAFLNSSGNSSGP
jgi:mono/diheme cytochrome c family protein